jgi:hypothetical protein
MTRLSSLVIVVLLVAPLPARAQQSGGAPPNTLQVERIETGFVIAPDARFTRINDRTADLVGVYGGWMTEQTLLVGGGGYWLVNTARDFKMAYGGAVVEWFVRGDRQAGISTRAFIGGGRATLSNTLGELVGARALQESMTAARFGRLHNGRGFGRGTDSPRGDPASIRVIYSDNFFIAEPQINGFIKVTDWLRFNAGVGYRLIGGTSDSNIDERLRGVSGSIAVVLGGS